MPTIGPIIAASAKLGLSYAERLIADIKEEDFARLASFGDQIVESNHPAFVVGHLSIYPARILADLGIESGPIQPTPESLALFSPSAKCVDDPDRSIYPGKDQLVGTLLQNYATAIDSLEGSPDDAFVAANPNEKMRSKLPTLGAMHAFYVGGHFMVHMGQVSAWRRMFAMAPA